MHDLIMADLGVDWQPRSPIHSPGRGEAGRQLARLLRERREFGLRKYGTVLQVNEPHRDPTQDFLEEIADALCYAYRMKAHGVPGGAEMYEAVLALAGAAARRWYWPASAGDARPDSRGPTLAEWDDLRAGA